MRIIYDYAPRRRYKHDWPNAIATGIILAVWIVLVGMFMLAVGDGP